MNLSLRLLPELEKEKVQLADTIDRFYVTWNVYKKFDMKRGYDLGWMYKIPSKLVKYDKGTVSEYITYKSSTLLLLLFVIRTDFA